MIKKLDAYKLYLGLMFFTSLFFSLIFVVTSLYEASVVGLSGLQLVLVGTTLEVTILVFEIPTGVVADAFSRRLSIIIGYFIMGTGFMLEGLFPTFFTVLVAQVLWGLGYTFTSGATQAWLSDEIGEAQANHAFLRANRFELVGGLLGMLLAVPLGNLAVNVPIVAGGACITTIALVLTAYMPENGFTPVRQEERNNWQHMTDIFNKGLSVVHARPSLAAILGVGLVYGLYSEGWDRLWVKFLLDNFSIPSLLGMNSVAFFGLLRVGSMLLALISNKFVEKRLDINHAPAVAKALIGFTAVLSFAIFIFAFSPTLAISIAAVWLVGITREVMGPLYNAWVNQRLSSDSRATVISMSGQVDAIGQIISGPLAGLVSLWSVQVAIAFAALLITPALPLIHRANRIHADEEWQANTTKTGLE